MSLILFKLIPVIIPFVISLTISLILSGPIIVKYELTIAKISDKIIGIRYGLIFFNK